MLNLPAKGSREIKRLDPISHMTPQQRQVAELIGLGWSDKRIAEELVLSVHTVENHARSLHLIFGVIGPRTLAIVCYQTFHEQQG